MQEKAFGTGIKSNLVVEVSWSSVEIRGLESAVALAISIWFVRASGGADRSLTWPQAWAIDWARNSLIRWLVAPQVVSRWGESQRLLV